MSKLALPVHLDLNIAGDPLMEGGVIIAVVTIMHGTADGETESLTENAFLLWVLCNVFPLLEATTKLLEATPSWQLYHSSAWSSEFSLKHYELIGCGYVDSSPQKPLARQTLYIAKPFFNDEDAWMLKQWGTKVLDHWTKRGVLKIPCNISLISWVKSWE